jgi:transposase-like protein
LFYVKAVSVTVSKLVKLGFNSVSGAISRSPRKQNLKKRWLDYMRLSLILPVVEPEQFPEPERCAHPKCQGKYFRIRQEVAKNLRDTQYEQVVARRYECLRCHRTFRVYPRGVLAGQFSQRVKGMGVMLYVLGLSYGAVALVLNALGVWISKVSVYRAMQATAERVPGMKREQFLAGYRTRALGADVTYVKCNGRWLPLGITVDAVTGLVLTIDQLSGEEAHILQEWVAPIADGVDARVLVSDDADAFKTVADEQGLSQQVCKSHVVRNTDALIENLSQAIRAGADHSLTALGIDPEGALADLRLLGELIQARLPEQQPLVEALYLRYAKAPAPHPGQSACLAYRIRNLFLDRWGLWPRLTFYRTWKNAIGDEILDGTNNASERAIGWWIKERYRSMRGYKREQSALNVSRLIAYCGNHLAQGLDLAQLVA